MSYYERNLPHWHPEGKPVFLTWWLFGSLPRGAVERIRNLHSDPRKQFLSAERLLHKMLSGPRWLAHFEIVMLVVKALERSQELGQCYLQAWVVMPNHVHVLLEPVISVQSITRGIKGVTAREANTVLARVGRPFWQDESFDHWVRNAAEFERVRIYIENNPVKAGLAQRPEGWPWSSASTSRAEH